MKSFAPIVFAFILCFAFSKSVAQDTAAVRYMKNGKELDLSRGYSGGSMSFILELEPSADYQILWQAELVRGKSTIKKISGGGKEVGLAGLGTSAPGDRIIFTIRRVTVKKEGKFEVVKASPSMSVIPVF